MRNFGGVCGVCDFGCRRSHGFRILDGESGKVIGKSDAVHSEKIGAVACGGMSKTVATIDSHKHRARRTPHCICAWK